MTDLSNNALIFWFSFFLTPRNTLRFGGEGATMEITPEGRTALNDLIAAGYAVPIKADDRVAGREHFGATPGCLREVIKARCGGDPFEWAKQNEFTIFRKIEART